MKKATIDYLSEKGKPEIFTDERYQTVKQVMQHGMKQDAWLNNYLRLDPLNKAEWIADHMVLLCDAGKI